jgi:ubiquinone/menaquinone biosynthesis C-methylase UbiE
LLWLYLINETNLLKSHRIKLFHPAPELCFYEKFIRIKNIDYYPSDISEKGLLNIDLTDIKYQDNSFDYIICNHILEHIPDDKKAINELYRVLKPTGMAIIMVPINEKFEKTYEDPSITTPHERERHFGQWDHVRWYGMDIKERFLSAGFAVEMIRYSDFFDIETRNNMGLCDDFIIILYKRNT